MPKVNKLTDQGIKALTKPGLYSDGLGLYLQVSAFGTKSWLFRFMRDGKARKMGLGAVHTISLKAARQKALECRIKLDAGFDPIEDRKATRAALRAQTAKMMTFKECAQKYIEAHRATWKNPKHAEQWPSTLKTYVYPTIGDLSVDAVDVGLVLKILEPIWQEKPETASRVRGRIETILDWAAARKHRHGDNPARWRGHLDKLLPARGRVAKVKHHEALAYREIQPLMAELQANESSSARALEFTILTAVRTNEALGAVWSEIDKDNRMWTIPAERMKGGREHRVPLSDRAIAILDALPREKDADIVFVGASKGKALSNMAMLEMIRGLRPGKGLTVHGFRSTFRDWAAEQTAFPNELVEMALAHAVSDKVEAAYRRGDMLDRRRRLMKEWAEYCSMPARSADVVTIRSSIDG
ncbi:MULTISPECIES: site-specific integrase [unclassified Rhizobium]|uniref:tyrosine-type recombinase/integrase n=1 Tax=unclassified Rhizobium TaxID=2613769 RepID=UPI00161B29A9|nr:MULTISPECIES: site-specific integrase [unclassified Rhizobium]MBB3288763.1 integrase [Rhizobium sp. BK252]MBB3403505.1 integrase [Rhizobium sp. BK289]MBB3416310.1 integrase [Rhizobium sp. BK284]MBB3483968.1 integrase [Rhizobium sp. BK347]